MSLFSSLTTAITGLNAQQDAIGNISDNISNANTVGFKRIDTGFENLVTESTPQLNQPGGVVAAPIYQNSLPGNLTPSSVPTSLAIGGTTPGFFQVKAPPPAAAQGVPPVFSQQNLYTQAGDFTLNKDGFLVNSAGYFLTAYPVTNPQTKTVNTSTTVPVQVSQLIDAPQATSSFSLAANLPSSFAFKFNQPIPAAPALPTLNPAYVPPSPVTQQVFDSTGAAHTETIQFDHISPNTWTATIGSAGSQPATNTPSVLQLTFGDGVATFPASPVVAPAGTLLNIKDITPAAVAPATTPTAAVIPGAASATAATFSLPLSFGLGAQNINFNFGTYGQPAGVTQFDDKTVSVQSVNQDGIPRGSFSDLSIDQNGFVNIKYTNGQSLSFFQIPVVQFNAPDQLQRLQGSAFSSTIDSGSPSINPPGTNGGGLIAPSTLEASNVDIASEFTKLITAQQVYSANSKVITTTDRLLTTIIGLIQ
jgi:flagellar hook protein FlgE